VSTPPDEPGEREGAAEEEAAGEQPSGGAPRGVVLAMLAALAVVGAIVAFVVVHDSGSSTSQGTTGADVTVPTAIGVVTAPVTGSTTTSPAQTTVPSVPTRTAPTTTTAPPATQPTPGTTAAGTWPPGVSGYTVVLRSLPKSGTSEQQARAVARGITGVTAGVLDSSRYASLNPGWWVVYAGRYATLTQADAAAARLRAAGHAGVYARRVAA
jgi:cell division septation protein DedD